AAAASWDFAAVALALALLALLLWKGNWRTWTEAVLIPASVVAVIFLVLPISHAHATETRTSISEDQASHIRTALDALRQHGGARPIRITASSAFEPIVNFYRAQHRLSNWQRATANPNAADADYYIVTGSDLEYLDRPNLQVVYKDTGIVMARRSHDPM